MREASERKSTKDLQRQKTSDDDDYRANMKLNEKQIIIKLLLHMEVEFYYELIY